MIVIPAITTDQRNAVFIGFNKEDLEELQENEMRFAVLNFDELKLTKPGGAVKVIFLIGETDEACKEKVKNSHHAKEFKLH